MSTTQSSKYRVSVNTDLLRKEVGKIKNVENRYTIKGLMHEH